MTRLVTTVKPDTPLHAVVDQLIHRGVKALPVVDDNRRVVGIITGGDLLRRGALGARLSIQGTLQPAELSTPVGRLGTVEGTARDVMTPSPRTITAEATIDEAIRLLVRHGIKRLPVVEDGGRLVGIVSRTDLLRAIAADGDGPVADTPAPAHARTVADLRTDVPTVAPTATLDEVLNAILRSPFRRVIVTDEERQVLGIITDGTLLARVDPSIRPSLLQRLAGRGALAPAPAVVPLTAAALMESDVFTVSAEATVVEAIRQFLTRRVKRLVVVDAEGRLLGMIDRRAVLRSFVDEEKIS